MKLPKKIQALITAVRKILLNVFLWQAYYFAMGGTVIFLWIFNRKSLWGRGNREGSLWLEAKGYGPEDHDILRQS